MSSNEKYTKYYDGPVIIREDVTIEELNAEIERNKKISETLNSWEDAVNLLDKEH